MQKTAATKSLIPLRGLISQTLKCQKRTDNKYVHYDDNVDDNDVDDDDDDDDWSDCNLGDGGL